MPADTQPGSTPGFADAKRTDASCRPTLVGVKITVTMHEPAAGTVAPEQESTATLKAAASVPEMVTPGLASEMSAVP
jgi:hypothetical protein